MRADNRLVFCLATDPGATRMAGQRVASAREFTSRFEALAAAPHRGGQKQGSGGGGNGAGQHALSAKWGQHQRAMVSRATPPPPPAPSKKPWTMLADGSIQYQAGAWAAAGGGGGSAAAGGGGSKQADRAWARAQGSTDGYGKPASQEQRGWYH